MPASQPARAAAGESPRAYWRFYREVASAQLAEWLPREPLRILDLSGVPGGVTRQMAGAGHDIIKIVDPGDGTMALPAGRVRVLAADRARLSYLADSCVDAVVAEARALSFSLATETTVEEAARVLRPDGRMFVCVDSLVLGMAQLAQRRCWAELSDAPSADVLLVPSAEGTITRCFWPEQLRELLDDAGLEVEWIRPRTVLSPPTVEQALAADQGVLPDLVRAELSLSRDNADESVGIHLVASARRVRERRAS
ncbi:MAG: class I SAM-dependent methyltransferase [Streptosporangiaceae bacterium]